MFARTEVDCHFKGIICARLSSGEKSAGGAQDGRPHRINPVLVHQAQRHPLSQFRVSARQPCLHHGGRILLAKGNLILSAISWADFRETSVCSA